MLLQQIGRSSGAALHAVDHDNVRARLGGELDIVIDAAGAQLDEDRHLPIGRLAQLLDLDDHVVRAEEIGMPARTALIDAGRQIPLASNLGGNL